LLSVNFIEQYLDLVFLATLRFQEIIVKILKFFLDLQGSLISDSFIKIRMHLPEALYLWFLKPDFLDSVSNLLKQPKYLKTKKQPGDFSQGCFYILLKT
jgi:hypothetical protein